MVVHHGGGQELVDEQPVWCSRPWFLTRTTPGTSGGDSDAVGGTVPAEGLTMVRAMVARSVEREGSSGEFLLM
jgi:hypothetical protein